MSDNKIYQALLNSLEDLHRVNAQNQSDKASMELFRGYLRKNWEALCKFKKAIGEIEAYLDGFRFDTDLELDSRVDDLNVLLKINEELESHHEIVETFRACKEELFQYISESFHSKKDDLETVKNHITSLIKVKNRINEIKKSIVIIEDCSDRHKKQEVVDRYYSTIKQMYNVMSFDQIKQYESKLDKIKKDAADVSQAFQEEYNQVVSIKRRLENDSPEMWREDKERLLNDVVGLLSKDISRMNFFNIKDLCDEVERSVAARSRIIQDTLSRYGWLNSSKYRGFHEGLTSRCISFSEYKSHIDVIRKERNKKTWKIVGWTFGIVAVVAIVVNYWQVILGGIAIIAVLGMASLFGGSKD